MMSIASMARVIPEETAVDDVTELMIGNLEREKMVQAASAYHSDAASEEHWDKPRRYRRQCRNHGAGIGAEFVSALRRWATNECRNQRRTKT